MNKLVKDALVLTAITIIAGLLLGGVYQITKEPIAQANEQATQDAYRAVFAEADSFADCEAFDAESANQIIADAGYQGDITNCEIANVVEALDASGNKLGYVVTITSHSGYGGDITFSIGVTNDGTLNGYSITDISETAGLGMKAKESKFMDQFTGIPAETVELSKNGGTIEAISGATITSKAMTYGIDAGMLYISSLNGGAANE